MVGGLLGGAASRAVAVRPILAPAAVTSRRPRRDTLSDDVIDDVAYRFVESPTIAPTGVSHVARPLRGMGTGRARPQSPVRAHSQSRGDPQRAYAPYAEYLGLYVDVWA